VAVTKHNVMKAHMQLKGKCLYVLDFDTRIGGDEWPYNPQGNIPLCHCRPHVS
jgi:hypothetical protein